MVTRSPHWRQIAQELRLEDDASGSGKPRGGGRPSRLCYEAAEAQMCKSGALPRDEVPKQVVRRETAALVRKSLEPSVAEDLLHELERGERTEEDVRAIAETVAAEAKDDTTRPRRRR
jgi:hypothetical protein